jgi:hypothetical protein
MKIKDVVVESADCQLQTGDSFDIELGDLVIETGIVGFTDDGVILEADEKTLALLGMSGALLENVNVSEVSLGDYHRKATIGKGVAQMGAAFARSPEDREKNLGIAARREKGLARSKMRGEKKAAELAATRKSEQEQALRDKYTGVDIDAEIARLQPAIERAYHDYQYGARNTYSSARDEYQSLQAKVQELERAKAVVKQELDEISDRLRNDYVQQASTDFGHASFAARSAKSHPGLEKYSQEQAARAKKRATGLQRALSDKRLGREQDVSEAEYQGRNVPLGKPMQGDVKKSKVYVRGPKGNVVKVNFGDKKMKIKKSNPKRRKSFRARHNCANPGPRWKARYWSCRAW